MQRRDFNKFVASIPFIGGWLSALASEAAAPIVNGEIAEYVSVPSSHRLVGDMVRDEVTKKVSFIVTEKHPTTPQTRAGSLLATGKWNVWTGLKNDVFTLHISPTCAEVVNSDMVRVAVFYRQNDGSTEDGQLIKDEAEKTMDWLIPDRRHSFFAPYVNNPIKIDGVEKGGRSALTDRVWLRESNAGWPYTECDIRVYGE